MKQKENEPGWYGFDEKGRQQCLKCWKWQFPVIHSCPGVPNMDITLEGKAVGRTPPPVDIAHFDCPVCHRISYHPVDAKEGYCGFCHKWTG